MRVSVMRADVKSRRMPESSNILEVITGGVGSNTCSGALIASIHRTIQAKKIVAVAIAPMKIAAGNNAIIECRLTKMKG